MDIGLELSHRLTSSTPSFAVSSWSIELVSNVSIELSIFSFMPCEEDGRGRNDYTLIVPPENNYDKKTQYLRGLRHFILRTFEVGITNAIGHTHI